MEKIHVDEIRKDFSILESGVIYVDNAATTHKPKQVIDAITHFYEEENANIHRGLYDLSVHATEKYEAARTTVAQFINAQVNEIIFTKGTTESLNFLATVLEPLIEEGKDEILLTEMEHHANIVPWQQLAKRKNMKVLFVKIKEDYTLDMDDLQEKISEKTAIVSVTHISNTLGTINNVQEIVRHAKEKGAFSVIDGAQSAGHMKINVKDIDCDFFVFSGHKMCGPTGIGVLYGKMEHLEKIEPYQFGGDMIEAVTKEETTFAPIPKRFEAGTQHIAGALGLAEAVRYLENIGMEQIMSIEEELATYAVEKLEKIKGITLFVPPKDSRSGIISCTLEGIHTHDIASLLNDSKICIRGGKHCTMPLHEVLSVSGTNRLSFYFYNTKEEIDRIVVSLQKIVETFA